MNVSTPSLEATDARHGSGLQRSLLVVDDELGPRQSLQMVFKEDYCVLLADSGERALEIIETQPVDAAVLDIRMAGMSGTELLRKLKQVDPDIEVIMLTAYETIDTAREAIKYGARDYLTKPFDLETMRSAVANAMDHRVLSEQRTSNLQRLAQLQDELQNQKVEEEIVRTKGEIYASVLHDINGPLTIISGFVEIINNHLRGVTSVEGQSLDLIKDRLSRIARQVTNCIDISQRYLSFLRRPTQTGASVSVAQVLQDVLELLKVHHSLRQNELTVDPPEPDFQAVINGANLIQLILNLAINALQSSPAPHRVGIDARLLKRAVDLASIKDGPGTRFLNREGFRNTQPLVAITVEDDGPGIAPEVLDKIFQCRTFDAYYSTKEAGKGTGLGTAIVQRFVRDAGGGLHLETRVNQGTRITVYLPAGV